MNPTVAAAVFLADGALRKVAIGALEARGYAASAVDRDAALRAVEAGNLTLLEIGLSGVAPADLAAAQRRCVPRAARAVLAAVDPRDAAALNGALEAGATSILTIPFDADALTACLAGAERWAREWGRVQVLLDHMVDRVLVLDPSGRTVLVDRGQARSAAAPRACSPSLAELAPDLREPIEHAIALARASARPENHEAAVGATWCRFRAIPLGDPPGSDGFGLVVTDATEQHRAELELRASSAKSAALLDALPDMVFRMTAAGRYLDFRAERVESLLTPPDQIIGRTVRDTLPPDLATLIEAHMARAVATGIVQRIEYSLETPIGPRDFEARLNATGSDEVVAIVRDVTEIKQLQARLALADRLAALGTLSAGVAHEINNPLTYILIGIESVLKEIRKRDATEALGPRKEVVIERLQGAMEGARRVRRIVSDLRTFARADEEDDKRIDPRHVLDAAASMVDSQIRYRARLIRDYAETPPIRGNQDRLVQVFVNLLLNAVQALKESEAYRNTIRLRVALDDSGRVALEVEDSGHGIDIEDLGRIFDPFFTTKPTGEGTGLGLWICHSIVTGHGGSIAVQSRPGEGTTFRVVLPAASPAVEDPASGGDESPIPAPTGRILIVDDDEQVAHSLAILFEGCDLTVLDSGRAAVDRLTRGEQFDWIFCDLMMPDLSGMDVFEEVLRVRPALEGRFVFMTGGVFTPRARDFVARVSNPCLSKPFHPRQVAGALRQLGPRGGQRR